MPLRHVGMGLGAILLCTATASATAPLPMKSKAPEPRVPSWVHPMPVDHGIRADRSGRGHFGASRYHGQHNGLDLLAPIGTAIHAVCAGEARGGTRGAFGNYVHLVCEVPPKLAGDDTMYASFFFAHLQQKNVPHGKWVKVALSDKIGAVGKTGNAVGPSVMPHVHLELILHPSAEDARAERHSGKNQSNTVAADRFFRSLSASCLETTGLSSKGPWRRARRADPFAVLTCLSVKKPKLTEPEAPLDKAWRKWSSHYHADDFDVDVGRR